MKQEASPIGHRTMAVAAAEEFRRRILGGEFPEGTQLKQDALASAFGISRIPLREALVQLESEGLVRIVPHKGAIVSQLSAAEVSELFELRALLEPRLLRRSAPLLTPQDYEALDDILREYSSEMRALHPGRWGELNGRLHEVLLSRADHPRTSAIVATLLQQTDRYTRLQLSLTQASRARAEEEHEQLVELCRRKAVPQACALLRKHIHNAGAELVSFIRQRNRAKG